MSGPPLMTCGHPITDLWLTKCRVEDGKRWATLRCVACQRFRRPPKAAQGRRGR